MAVRKFYEFEKVEIPYNRMNEVSFRALSLQKSQLEVQVLLQAHVPQNLESPREVAIEIQ